MTHFEDFFPRNPAVFVFGTELSLVDQTWRQLDSLFAQTIICNVLIG